MDIALGSAFAAYAFLIRQFGVLPAVAYVCVMLVLWRREPRRPAAANLIAFVAPWIVAVAFLAICKATIGSNSAIPEAIDMPIGERVGLAVQHAAAIALYMGMFLLSIGLTSIAWARPRGRKVRWAPAWLHIGMALWQGRWLPHTEGDLTEVELCDIITW